VTGAADRIEFDDTWMQVNLYSWSASAQFFPEGIGKGVFGRADIGPAYLSFESIGIMKGLFYCMVK
jgi:hypothetical protein